MSPSTLTRALRFNPTSINKFVSSTSSSSSAASRFFTSNASSARQYSTFRNAFARTRFAGKQAKRFQSTEAAAATATAQVSWFKKMWDSPIGVKTVHFWAPVMKWALVLAGISDLARPAEKLSLTQNAALTATGIIWTRWCLIIKPRNILLATVNFFLGMVGVVQVTRILLHQRSEKNKSLTDKAAEVGHEVKGKVENAIKS
ncbi:uncharacterized protein EAE97_001799 [Botrytis byssoidea]|uniref:Mitochondrial pyruvate carrier n=1 Tax=Botrytis byssoidea TaxID=139641 RepID=A0A9P5IYG8_9HELO|nr:uncharacterized protein EAE97_001799 [Botrytis byssoidea]KAF7898460.1 hypothetical protein EAF00_004906 [Botryotinia globosa]KAF7952302.1 hypothetical protein EAE97_001799 [Botrytis byssoidea]